MHASLEMIESGREISTQSRFHQALCIYERGDAAGSDRRDVSLRSLTRERQRLSSVAETSARRFIEFDIQPVAFAEQSPLLGCRLELGLWECAILALWFQVQPERAVDAGEGLGVLLDQADAVALSQTPLGQP
jgi:hypothetical protein